MISRGVKNGIIGVSALQLILGLLLLIVYQVWMYERGVRDRTSSPYWWRYGIPYVAIAACGFVAPKRQTFMGVYLVLNIVGLVLAACWWAEMIPTLSILGTDACTSSAKYIENYDSFVNSSCVTFRYVLGLTILTGLSAVMCMLGIIMTARNISDDNTVQNVGHVYGQYENPTVVQTPEYYASQPTSGVHYAQTQLPPQYVPMVSTEQQKTFM